jgi:OFA family oxalate/formate antiporter-like MFS transporter
VTILIAAALLAGGYLVASSVSSEGLNVLTIAYGAFVGGSTGMAHNATLSSVNRWFPDRVGVSSGLLTLGFGLGSLAIGTIAGLGIDALGWRWSFRVIGMVTALVMFGASFFVRVPPEGQKLPPVPASSLASGSQLSRTAVEERDYTTRQMLGQKAFYLTFFWAVMVAATYLSIMGNAKQIALEVGALGQLATFMVGFISLFDGVGRLTSGIFFDRFGYRPSLIAIPSLYLIASILLFVATSYNALPAIFAGYLLVGLGSGSISTVLAAVTNRFYGQKNYAGNLAVAYMDFIPASLIGPPLLGLIETTTGSYQYGFAVLMVFSVLGILAALLIRPPRDAKRYTVRHE